VTAQEREGSISRQGSSYRQGLVLGLTMAEIMLLLVFCLLIAMATFLRTEQRKNDELEKKLHDAGMITDREQRFVSALEKYPGLYERFKKIPESDGGAAIDEFWRELVDDQSFVSDLKKSGLSLQAAKQQLLEPPKQKDTGIDPQQAKADAALLAKLVGLLPSDQASKPEVGLVDAVRKGVSAANDGHRWPPIISLSEAQGYYFKSGSAELSEPFRDALLHKTPEEILKNIKLYDVDVVEVVGHTDEQPLGLRSSNLDRELPSVLTNAAPVATLQPADNAGLGLARAVSVVSVLRQVSALGNYKIIPLSGAQLVNTDETLAVNSQPLDVKQRRRIEIRLRKSTPQQASEFSLTQPNQAPSVPAKAPRAKKGPTPAPVGQPVQLSPFRFLHPFGGSAN
jgi:flagellar motor protein MotB